MGLKNSLNKQSNELSTIDDEIINVLDPENVEADVDDSMKITEPYHDIEVKLQALSGEACYRTRTRPHTRKSV